MWIPDWCQKVHQLISQIGYFHFDAGSVPNWVFYDYYIYASTSPSCSLSPVLVLGVPAHRGLVHGVLLGCHSCRPTRCRGSWSSRLSLSACFSLWPGSRGSKPSLLPCSQVSSLSPLSSCLPLPGSCTSFKPLCPPV